MPPLRPLVPLGLLLAAIFSATTVEAPGFPGGREEQALSARRSVRGLNRIVQVDSSHKTIWLQNAALRLELRYGSRCEVASLSLGDKPVLGIEGCGYTGIQLDSVWYTSRQLLGPPEVRAYEDSVTLRGIRYAAGNEAVEEEWTLALEPDGAIDWSIERKLSRPLMLGDNAFPALRVGSRKTFEGAVLGTGGVAWFQLFDDSAAAYGVHTEQATLWSDSGKYCLRMESKREGGEKAAKFMREGESVSVVFTVSPHELTYRFDADTHRRRFIRFRTDVWEPSVYPAGMYRQKLRLTAPAFEQEYGRGELKGVDGQAVGRLMNTAARLGVIDAKHFGGNSWHTPYGPLCLHEQYIAQFGIGIDDPHYITGYQQCLDFQRDHAILPSGRVKSRWAYTDEWALPGTADSLGFQEAVWGILLDSQTDFVINVADLFDQSGDTSWLRTHKASCEKVLEYLLRRDTNGNSLVEMMTDSHTEGKGSDWIDIIWASWENALVNAKLSHALDRWSVLEELLEDSAKAAKYRNFAHGLRASFNKPTSQGGFWDEKNRWYVYWRDRDGSVHGNNLVVPVNLMAVAYDITVDRSRRTSILQTLEAVMQKEKLFFWPLNCLSYKPGEGHDFNFPYPMYENGDLFLSWGELGVRAYAASNPETALRYCRNVLAQYRKDGLAYQRYLRETQEGSGDDILSGNCATIIGLYRDIYGVQPRYNRLFLQPHLARELYGTRLRYRYQGREYLIELDSACTAVAADGWRISCQESFGVKSQGARFAFHWRSSASANMVLEKPDALRELSVVIQTWGLRHIWTERCPRSTAAVIHEVVAPEDLSAYEVYCNGRKLPVPPVSPGGTLRFAYAGYDGTDQVFELRRVQKANREAAP